MQTKVHVIIVTHNSSPVVGRCLKALGSQTVPPCTITIVDSGSTDRDYLGNLKASNVNIIETSNVGFAKANNIGVNSLTLSEDDCVLFLNPDAFLKPNAIEKMVQVLGDKKFAGAITGKLLGYDLKSDTKSGQIDSTGVFRNWYGRWYDRGQGEEDSKIYDTAQTVPAICGALFCCSARALQSLKGKIFEERFFMYKEDIELSLRLRKTGWKLWYDPQILAYHCRGWNSNRTAVPYEVRLMSARNEVILYQKHPSVYILWAMFKFLLVRFFRI